VSREIEVGAALENCGALIDQIIARLSVEKPFVNVSSAAELLSQEDTPRHGPRNAAATAFTC
jgi:hypothetical protein